MKYTAMGTAAHSKTINLIESTSPFEEQQPSGLQGHTKPVFAPAVPIPISSRISCAKSGEAGSQDPRVALGAGRAVNALARRSQIRRRLSSIGNKADRPGAPLNVSSLGGRAIWQFHQLRNGKGGFLE